MEVDFEGIAGNDFGGNTKIVPIEDGSERSEHAHEELREKWHQQRATAKEIR